MKKIILLSISYFIGLQVFAQRSNCAVSPEANTITQTDDDQHPGAPRFVLRNPP